MIEQGIPRASVLNIVSLRDVTADYFAIWADWIDVALLHFNSRDGRPPHAGWPESAADETGATTEYGEGGAATEQAEGGVQAEMEDVQADRANDTMENLSDKLAEFLTVLLLEVWSQSGFHHATEQAKLDWKDDCHDMVCDKIIEWYDDHQRSDLYGTPELLLRKRMWDIVTHDRDGRAKEQRFSEWCRRVASAALYSEDSTVTEEAESSASFRSLAEDILTHELTDA